MAFRPRPDDKSAAETTPPTELIFLLRPRCPPPGNGAITSGLSENYPGSGMPLEWEREEKLPSALGRQVGRQADIELYISIS